MPPNGRFSRTHLLLFFVISAACISTQAQTEKTWIDHYWTGADDIKFHYIEQGEGTPIVLIHGLGSSAVCNWFNTGVAQELAKTNWVIALDMRGHGETPRQSEDSHGSTLVDVLNLMDHLQIERAHIGGYSMGGATTVGLMKLAPQRFITASILGAGVPESEGWVKVATRGSDIENDPKIVAGIDLTTINFPVLGINGENDLADKRREPLASGLADLTYVVIPGANHMSAPRHPEFVTALVNFIVANNPAE